MCRIFGILGNSMNAMDGMVLASNCQYKGGPDEQSLLVRDRWALGANRLSIQDVQNGTQPSSLGGKIFCVLNGEVYNFRELKKELTDKGHIIDSNCDTAIIPALYAEYGEAFAEKLDGMFAVALIDLREAPKLILACDHLGIKSMFYKKENDRVIFSSEIDGIRNITRKSEKVRIEKIDMYFSMQSIIGEESIYENIKSLQPGIVMTWNLDGTCRTIHYNPPEPCFPNIHTYEDYAECLENMLKNEIDNMLSADVPVCLVTSGGLDSSLVSSMVAEKKPGMKAFNIAYKGDWPDDERKYAIELANYKNIDLEVINADPAGFIKLLPEMVGYLGQPNAAPHSLSTYILFQKINESGFKVAITGEGADEQFGGYDRFADAISGTADYWSGIYLDKLSAITSNWRDRLYTDDYKNYLMENPSGYEKVVNEICKKPDKDSLDYLLDYDKFKRFPYYILRRVDHLSMANSVEVRVPFCQPSITHFASRIPQEWKIKDGKVKRILYKAAEKYVPESIINRKKQPFTLPIQSMLAPGQDLFDYFAETVLNGRLIKDGVVKRKTVEGLLGNFVAEKAKILWTLGIYEIWAANKQGNNMTNVLLGN